MKPIIAEPPQDITGPVDEDLLLAGTCTLGHATPEQMAEFEKRYVEDDAFYVRVSPLIAALLAPVNYRQLIAEANARDADGAAESRYASPPPRRERFGSLTDVLFTGVKVMAAASLILGASYFLWIADLGTPRPPRVIADIPVEKPPTATNQGAAPAVQGTQPVTRRSRVYLGVLDISGAETRTDSSAEKVVELEGGALVRLRPGSSIREAAMPASRIMRTLEVKGEIAIIVTGKALTYQVISRAGMVTLMPGSYALRCAGACDALEVTVAKGTAMLAPDVLGVPSLQLQTGGQGRAFRDSAAVMVTGAAAAKFPAPDAAFTAQAVQNAELRKSP